MGNLGELDDESIGGLLVLVCFGCVGRIFDDYEFDVFVFNFEFLDMNLHIPVLGFGFDCAVYRLARTFATCDFFQSKYFDTMTIFSLELYFGQMIQRFRGR